MINSTRGRIVTFAVFVVLAASLAFAQNPAPADAPFENVQGRLKVGQTAEVVDNAGLTIRGKVVELTPSSLVLAGGTGTKSFGAADVAIIRRTGAIWDGAVKGAAIGVAPVLIAAAATDCFDCNLAGVAAFCAGVGAGVGLGIDALFGPRTVYRAAAQRPTVSVAPIFSRDRRGFGASIGF